MTHHTSTQPIDAVLPPGPKPVFQHRLFTQVANLQIYYNNVRSIANKRHICSRIELSSYEVLCFTETWLTSNQSDSCFPGNFKVYRCDRDSVTDSTTARAGGVAVLVHSKYKSRQIQHSSVEKCECLAIEIMLKPVPLIIYAAYIRVLNETRRTD